PRSRAPRHARTLRRAAATCRFRPRPRTAGTRPAPLVPRRAAVRRAGAELRARAAGPSWHRARDRYWRLLGQTTTAREGLSTKHQGSFRGGAPSRTRLAGSSLSEVIRRSRREFAMTAVIEEPSETAPGQMVGRLAGKVAVVTGASKGIGAE